MGEVGLANYSLIVIFNKCVYISLLLLTTKSAFVNHCISPFTNLCVEGQMDVHEIIEYTPPCVPLMCNICPGLLVLLFGSYFNHDFN